MLLNLTTSVPYVRKAPPRKVSMKNMFPTCEQEFGNEACEHEPEPDELSNKEIMEINFSENLRR